MTAWADIFGQDEAVASLRQAYLAERLPHGLIFAGPAGVGKATTAAALSQVFLCEHPKGDVACGKCESCRVFAAGNHPDFHVVTKELIRYHDKTGKSKGIDLSINVIRAELIEPASRKAAMGTGKVFIVEQAELMNAAAQNALLKTLEEPGGRTLIVLLTDQPGILLATVRSRCRLVRFAALDAPLVARELAKRGVPKETAASAARIAGGSLGLALKWIEDGVVEPGLQLSAQIDQLLNGQAPEDLPGWFRKSADEYAVRQLDRDPLSSKEQAVREGLGIYLLIAAEHLRRLLPAAEASARLDTLCDMIEAIAQTEAYLDANVNVALSLQQLAVKMEMMKSE
jgi:DNA polymerase-3 subunit delta'